jgi:hypothetical protein
LPPSRYSFTNGKLDAWLNTNGESPREQAVKVTLRELLARG